MTDRAGRRERPMSSEPWVARSIEGGARLAVEEINADGGFDLEGGKRKAELVVLDHASSPATALANAREAVRRNAAVLLTDGTGVAAVGDITDRAALPTFILFQGGRDLSIQASPERVPARSGGRDHDPPARGLPRAREPEGGAAQRRHRLRRAGPGGAARRVRGRRGAGRLRPRDRARGPRPRAPGAGGTSRRRRPARGVGRRGGRGRGRRGRPPGGLGRAGPGRADRGGPARPSAPGGASRMDALAQVRLLADHGRGGSEAVRGLPQALRGPARRH